LESHWQPMSKVLEPKKGNINWSHCNKHHLTYSLIVMIFFWG
jgi:hypothetical protein